MITKQDRYCNIDYMGYAVSPVDATAGVTRGRPCHGVGFLWNTALDEYITILVCYYDWLCGVQISRNYRECYLLNVYLPYENEENRHMYNAYMAKSFMFYMGLIARVYLLLATSMQTCLRNLLLELSSKIFVMIFILL